jgi:hypothetical protein
MSERATDAELLEAAAEAQRDLAMMEAFGVDVRACELEAWLRLTVPLPTGPAERKRWERKTRVSVPTPPAPETAPAGTS